MVHKIEAACKKIDVEFLGWNKLASDVTLRFRRGGLFASLHLSMADLDMATIPDLRNRIYLLFVPPKDAQS